MAVSTIPEVSVVMPVYNGATTLPEALTSLREQSFGDFEIVVVDDGSRDETPQVLADWTDERVRVIEIPHSGIIEALNAGLNACRGELVARMDADDRCHPTRLQRQVEHLRAEPGLNLLASRVNAFPSDDVAEGFRIYLEWQNALITHEQICREIFIESPFAHPTVMFRRKPVLAMGAYQEHGWAEDYDLWLRMHHRGWSFAKLPEALVEWREHPDRATRTDSRYSVENFLRAKAHYLCAGPLAGRETIIVWGAGKTGRRLSKYLIRTGYAPAVFIDVVPGKIGSKLRQIPIIGPDDLAAARARLGQPFLLVAVASRGARELIRAELDRQHWTEGVDYLCVA
ncbi:MAG: glycosyltransferase [Candidatus Latescibacterota bacterium]|nr:glycosyltransferase [Candidatus Latescibacterota bacterium]